MISNPVQKSIAAAIILAFKAGMVPAVDLVWVGGTGDWNVANNWSPTQIPTSADNAWITNNGTYTVTVPAGSSANAGSLVIGGASGSQVLSIDRATVTLGAASTVNTHGQIALTVAQSVLTGAGNLTVNGSLDWQNGTLSGTGVVNVAPGGVLSIGTGGVTLARALNNSGTTTWAGGNFTFSAGAALNNLVGGTFDITSGGRLSGSATTPVNNSGLFRQVAGTAATDIGAPFTNSATLQVLVSTLNLNLGGSQSGTISNAPGASVNLGGGNHTLTSSSFVTGAGTVSVSGNATTLAASGIFDSGSSLSVTAGTATLSASCNIAGATLNIVGGALVFDSAGPVSSLNLSAGTLGGTSPINVTGSLTFSGGTITNALVTANGGLTISGNTTLSGTKLVNPTTAIWSAGNVVGANGAVFSNLLGATFINTFDGNMNSGAGAPPLFVNNGTFQKTNGTAAAGATSIDFQFINAGTVEVRTNTLRYAINQQTAGLTLLDGGNLTAQAQPLQILGGSLVGTGLVTVANVQNVVNSSSVSPGLPLGGLDIAGNYQQTVSGALNIELGGYDQGTNYDFIAVAAGGGNGIATLAGTLNITLTNGFTPTNGASFAFIKANSRVGSFSTFNYPTNDIGMQVNYDLTTATIKITNLKPSIANPISDPPAITYGTGFNFQFVANTFADPDNDSLTYTASGMPPGVTFSPATRTFSGAPTQAGTFQVTVTATDNGAPSLSVADIFDITILPATLAITADGQTKVYGGSDPPLTYSVSGLQLSDTAASVLTGALTRAAGENVADSPYAIMRGTLLANSNYVISFTGNNFTITPVPLSVTADAKTKIYGVVDPGFTVNYSGFVNGENPSVLNGTLGFSRAPGENVGTYSITPGGLTSSNYAITFNNGILTITKPALSVTADDSTKTYGASDPPFTVVYSGFVKGETQTALGGTLGFARAPGEDVGVYAVTPNGLTSSNYAITFRAGTLNIATADLSVTADAKTKTYGSADPDFTVHYTGFVNSETSNVLGGTLSFTRAPGENVGDYLVSPSGLTSSNYTIAFHAGALSISNATLSVTANARTKVYGASDPALTISVSGLQFSDTAVSVLTGALTRAVGENVSGSPYAISQGSLAANGNYSIAFTGSALTIMPAPLSIAADSKTKTYGAPDPTFTATFTAFANGETPAVLGGTLTFSRVAGEGVGTYTITPGGLTSSNYAITFNTGTLTITAPPPVISAPVVTSTNVTITWTSVSNATYRVQFRSSMTEADWIDLAGDVLATGGTALKTDVLSTNRFYRVRVLP